MNTQPLQRVGQRKTRSQRLRETVVAFVCDLDGPAIEELRSFTKDDWQRNFLWLDASGLALYFVDRLDKHGWWDAIPFSILKRLQQNLVDNRERTASLFAEMAEINSRFQKSGVTFANLKGLSLTPESVPDPTLRCQLDLDFLVATGQTSIARQVLTDMGYCLSAANRGTWEFKAGSSEVAAIKDLYKVKPQRSVELHLVDTAGNAVPLRTSTCSGQLQRAVVRPVLGVPMPTLSPADQFLNQALHLFGHIRGEFTRTSWGLEFARHLRSRGNDAAFWREVEELAAEVPEATTALGVPILLVEQVFGPAAPDALRRWTVDQLPAPVARWARMYGRRVMMADFPGNKLYLLLENELGPRRSDARQAALKRLLPFRLPPMITRGEAGEQLSTRLRRYVAQTRFVLFRLRFHVVQGARYCLEFLRWRWLKWRSATMSPVAQREREGQLQRNDISATDG